MGLDCNVLRLNSLTLVAGTKKETLLVDTLDSLSMAVLFLVRVILERGCILRLVLNMEVGLHCLTSWHSPMSRVEKMEIASIRSWILDRDLSSASHLLFTICYCATRYIRANSEYYWLFAVEFGASAVNGARSSQYRVRCRLPELHRDNDFPPKHP